MNHPQFWEARRGVWNAAIEARDFDRFVVCSRRRGRAGHTVLRTENSSPAWRCVDVIGSGRKLVDGVHPRADRPATAGFDRGRHRLLRPREHGLDRAVAAVAHPPLQPGLERRMLHEGAEADTLDPAAERHVARDTLAHAMAPVSIARAPFSRDGSQRSSRRT